MQKTLTLYNLLEYSKNHTVSLWNYNKDDPNSRPADNHNADPIINSASFKYKDSSIGKIPNSDNDNNNVIEKI